MKIENETDLCECWIGKALLGVAQSLNELSSSYYFNAMTIFYVMSQCNNVYCGQNVIESSPKTIHVIHDDELNAFKFIHILFLCKK